MLSFRLVTLFALVHLTNYKSAITLSVLDAALYDAHTYITSAVTNVPVSWSSHTVLEDRMPVYDVPTASMVQPRAQDAGFALSDSCTGVLGQAHGVYCGSSTMLTIPTLARHPSERARRPTSPFQLGPCPRPPIRTTPPSRSSVRTSLGSLLRMDPVSILSLRLYRIGFWSRSVFRQRRFNSDQPAPVTRSGPPPNTCTLPDLSHCGVGGLYFELIDVLPEYRPTYSPLLEVLLIGFALTVLIVAGLVYTGVLSLMWWMIHCVFYALTAVVSSAVKTVSALVNILSQAAICLLGVAAAHWRDLYSLWGGTVSDSDVQHGEQCYHDILSGSTLVGLSWTLDWSTSPNGYDAQRQRLPRVKPADGVRSTAQVRAIDVSARVRGVKPLPAPLAPAAKRELDSGSVAAPAIATDSDELCSFTDASSVGPASVHSSGLGHVSARLLPKSSRAKNRVRSWTRSRRPTLARGDGYEADHELSDREDKLDNPNLSNDSARRTGPDLSPPEVAIGTLGFEGELPLFGCVLLAALFLEDTDPDEPEPQPAFGPARFLFDCLMDYEP